MTFPPELKTQKTSSQDVAVIILAAGAGTRMKSSTPKMLHKVAGRTMLGHALFAAAGTNPSRIVVVTGHGADEVDAHIKHLEPRLKNEYTSTFITTANQPTQNGTGHAVACALDSPALTDFTGTIVVTTSDIPLLDSATLCALLAAHGKKPHAAVTVLTTTVDDATGYGRIVRSADGEVLRIVEEKDADPATRAIHEINSGVYAFEAALLRHAVQNLKTDNAQGELYLTDVVGLAREADRTVRAHQITDPALVSGVNDRVQLAAANKEFNRRIRLTHMRNGVTMTDPDSTFIDVDVTIAADVIIEPNCQLKGDTRIDTGAIIGPDTTLDSVTVGRNAQVIRTHGFSSVIGANANVGPFTFIRPGTHLGEGGKLGGFVETKNTTIGNNTKVPHLTYVGDATIGEGSNIGASSVFVNYDGVNKHHTTIGNHVRTGSDTMFIAPVTVGDGAYSGAGTVIRRDVPPGALTVNAAPQRIVEGWVAKKRPGTPADLAARAALDAAAAQQGKTGEDAPQ